MPYRTLFDNSKVILSLDAKLVNYLDTTNVGQLLGLVGFKNMT
jgi:hypothetical protein